MPFVEGESLRDRLRRERQLPVDDAVRIAREAAQALDYAHRHGVVHRDIKPENILLTADGDTLVADFGIARALQRRGRADEAAHRDRAHARHARLHEPRAGQRRARASTPARTSTRSARCSTRCSPASRPSRARRRRRCSRGGCSKTRRLSASTGRASRSRSSVPWRRPWPGCPPTDSRRPRSSCARSSRARRPGPATTVVIEPAAAAAAARPPAACAVRARVRARPAGDGDDGHAGAGSVPTGRPRRRGRQPGGRGAAVREPGRRGAGVLRRRCHRRHPGQARGDSRAAGDRTEQLERSTREAGRRRRRSPTSSAPSTSSPAPCAGSATAAAIGCR